VADTVQTPYPRGSALRRAAAGAGIAASLLLGGCFNYAAPLHTSAPTPATPTPVNRQLRDLPAPQEQIVAAVYRFRDQTGQYKPSDVMASWSTAVTQGSTSILMRALEDSGWFTAIEREGLSNLLSERQIIQSIRAQYTGPDGEPLGPLPPLLYAGVLLEGGIIGYDTNLMTGGAGIRYFGAGGSGQFRQDQVTVYLRAVSTQTGRVLKTVTTTKTIVSQQVSAGIFRFVDAERLLEAEVGYSVNEPPVVAVTEAIEEAVKNLILEGVRENLWALADPADLAHPAFADLDRAQDRSARLDAFGFTDAQDRTGFALSFATGARRYQGNYRDPLERLTGEVALRYFPSPRWGVGLVGAAGNIAALGAFETTAGSLEIQGSYFVLPGGSTTPFLRIGGGVMKPNLSANGREWGEQLFPFVSLGGGLEHMLVRGFGLSIALGNQYALMDGLDGVREGSGMDSVWNLTVGFSLYPTHGR
jgi:curli production assembly/transport component CsgG